MRFSIQKLSTIYQFNTSLGSLHTMNFSEHNDFQQTTNIDIDCKFASGDLYIVYNEWRFHVLIVKSVSFSDMFGGIFYWYNTGTAVHVEYASEWIPDLMVFNAVVTGSGRKLQLRLFVLDFDSKRTFFSHKWESVYGNTNKLLLLNY